MYDGEKKIPILGKTPYFPKMKNNELKPTQN